LNIGPKGFTGEKYGGLTYWDTEAFCLPFFLSTQSESVARNLLVYRYRHLEKAIENARKLGFTNNAALYPMVTINGEECHNEWEITFEEIHRNGAIAYAIYYFINYTGHKQYLVDFGLEVLIGIARFWKQRVSFSKAKNKFVILGVTGPNEYENNVNNNWYTNTMAVWCLRFTIDSITYVKKTSPSRWDEIAKKWSFFEKEEVAGWNDIIRNMYFPYDDKLGIFLQQDGYMDKELLTADDIPPEERPINQYWSWDRILRSCYIKQADVLQGIYFFEEKYDSDTIRKNFEFYEQRTVHESSLSACIHSIIASLIGDKIKAYELFLRSSRLDIDDYNNEVHEGLHITSMAGAWLSIVEGFGGKRIRNGKLCFYPLLPSAWKEYSFKILFENIDLLVTVDEKNVTLKSRGGSLLVEVYGSDVELSNGHPVEIPFKNRRQ
jgi:maltose phosphorylase